MKQFGTPGERMRAAVLVLSAMVGTWGCQGGGGSGDPDGGDTDDVDTDSDTDTGQDCYEGDLAIETADDVALLEPYDCVAGSVTVLDTGLTALDLSWIKGVEGDLIVGGNDDLASLDLGALVAVWGDFMLGDWTEEEGARQNPALTSVDVSSLAAAGGWLFVYGNTTLQNLEFPKLLSIGGGVSVGGTQGTENNSLATLSMPVLLEVSGGGISILLNSSLTTLEMGSLVSVSGDIWITETVSLKIAEFGSLSSVAGWLSFSSNSALTIISMPALSSVGIFLDIKDNQVLASMGMPSLTAVGSRLYIYDNPSLPQCEACEILEQLDSFPGDFFFHGNKPDECTDDCE
jgi:hypothetical protein